jgi:uncharacterized protein (DUF488 family)
MTTLFTIGYQGHAITTFCAILKAHGITMIVDVRERPFSRKPDFNKKRLSAHLTTTPPADALSDQLATFWHAHRAVATNCWSAAKPSDAD